MVETVLECLRLQCPVGETSPGYVMLQVEDQRKPCRNSCVLMSCLKNCPGYGVLLVAGRLSWNSCVSILRSEKTVLCLSCLWGLVKENCPGMSSKSATLSRPKPQVLYCKLNPKKTHTLQTNIPASSAGTDSFANTGKPASSWGSPDQIWPTIPTIPV